MLETSFLASNSMYIIISGVMVLYVNFMLVCLDSFSSILTNTYIFHDKSPFLGFWQLHVQPSRAKNWRGWRHDHCSCYHRFLNIHHVVLSPFLSYNLHDRPFTKWWFLGINPISRFITYGLFFNRAHTMLNNLNLVVNKKLTVRTKKSSASIFSQKLFSNIKRTYGKR